MKKKVIATIEVSDDGDTHCREDCNGYDYDRNTKECGCSIFDVNLEQNENGYMRCEECVNNELNKQETALKEKIIERLNAELIVMGGAELSPRYRDLILQTTLRGENENT